MATVAYAVLTGFTYYLWWKKPLDVRCSIAVYLLKDDKKDVDLQSISSVSPVANPDPVAVSTHISSDLNSNHVDSQSSPLSEETQILQQKLVVISGPGPNSQDPRKSESSHDDPTVTREPQSTGMHQLFAFIQRQTQRHGTVLGLAYAFLLHPLFSFFRAFANMLDSDSLHDSIPLRVPTFYSPKFNDNNSNTSAFAVAMCVAIIFGAIHCIAWSLHFPSPQERLAWRISAAFITGSPPLFVVFGLLSHIVEDRLWETIRIVTVVGLPASYVIARLVLLFLPRTALRALPRTSYSID